MTESYCLLTFQSTHQFMMAEDLLKKDFEIVIIPILREISSGCGIAIKINCDLAESVAQKLLDSNFPENAYQLWTIRYEKGIIIPVKEK